MDILTDLQKKFSLVLLGGDWNAKIGKIRNKEECVGKFSRGIRNNSGQQLI